MLQPTVRRTWAPRGHTPIHLSWDRHDRLSVISAISISSQRRRLGLYFDIRDHNIQTDEFETFVAATVRRLRRPITLVMDRLSVHRAGAKRLQARFGDSVQIEWLPAYAPELNPAEQVWKHTKFDDMPNFIPKDIYDLGHAISQSIRHTRSSQPLLKSFFEFAQLPL